MERAKTVLSRYRPPMSVQPASTSTSPPAVSSRPRRQPYPYWGAIYEATAKLAICTVLSAAAIAAIAELLPHYRAQQARLREVRAEVTAANTRVDRLRAEFARSFDPGQARDIMREQTARTSPELRRIVWKDADRD